METRNKMNAIKIKDAIADLEVIDILIARGRKAQAEKDLLELHATVEGVLGGSIKVCQLMDKFRAAFTPRYKALYA